MRRSMAALAVALAAAACGGDDVLEAPAADQVEQVAPAAAPCRDVTYLVDGTAASASVTFALAEGGTSQLASVRVGAKGGLDGGCALPGDYLYIAAQNAGESGTVRCRIVVGMNVVAEVTSAGAYSIATCDGVAP